MPQIGWFEILIIVAIAIIVIGPKDFPFMLKKLGSWIGSVKRYVSKVQEEISVLDSENFETKMEMAFYKKFKFSIFIIYNGFVII